MSTTHRKRLQRATAIVPLALISIAWTASVASPGATMAVSEDTAQTAGTLPDGTSLPTSAIEAPASLSAPGKVGAGSLGDIRGVSTNASTNDIPSAALSAYQRAEAVINAADEGCRIPWQLVAAIGRVESDHGRTNANSLSDEGLARPGIYGIALNGLGQTSKILDTDAGQLDEDKRFDRAVGPMQFLPSTWAVVGVDADGDGARNPQDIDDAALATAVYLCSGEEDLSERPGQRAAVFRYNRSKAYVDTVIAVLAAYQRGDFTSVPSSLSAAAPILPAPQPISPVGGASGGPSGGAPSDGGVDEGGSVPSSGGVETTDGSEGDTPVADPDPDGPDDGAPSPPAEPSTPDGGPVGDVVDGVGDTVKGLPGGGGSGGSGGSGGGSGGSGGGEPAVLTAAQASAKCLADNALLTPVCAPGLHRQADLTAPTTKGPPGDRAGLSRVRETGPAPRGRSRLRTQKNPLSRAPRRAQAGSFRW